MCLLDQTAYLVLLAVYVSCADRWLLCILCPCVYLTIGICFAVPTLLQLPFLLPVFVTDFLLYYYYMRDHTHRDKGLINYATMVYTLYVTSSVVDKK